MAEVADSWEKGTYEGMADSLENKELRRRIA